ncbi:MAG: DUF3817 domain-containing protein [Campylobacterales bacterium]|nr:DUF3817 domain-containing protein [Campylobacterales bacterium]
MLNRTPIEHFRLIGLIEGSSYLLLLFVAMPIKYILHDPSYVKVIGMIHGILFMLFVVIQIHTALRCKFSFKENFIYFMASLIPFGTFFTDGRLKKFQSVMIKEESR